MDIYTTLITKPCNIHYINRYVKFLDYCNKTNFGKKIKFERHHILPKSDDLFPEYKSFKLFPWNKINLTLRQHYIAHLILWKAFKGKQTHAFNLMSSRLNKTSSRIYETVRLEHSKLVSNNNSKIKKKTKEFREYDCTMCRDYFYKEEFLHHPRQSLPFCCLSCCARYNGKYGSHPTKGTKFKRNKPAWNKGLPNPKAADNARKGASKLSATVTGRKRLYKEDGTWTWHYPNK